MSNLFLGASPSLLHQIINDNKEVLVCITKGLRLVTSEQLVLSLLEAIETCCKHDIELQLQKEYSFKMMIECVEGLDEIEELQKNPNFQISNKATHILTTYFELAD